MKNQRGFTLIEMMIAVAVAMICIVGIFNAIQYFNQQNVRSTRALASRVLLAQIVGSIVARPDEYPPYTYGGSEGSYVLCFSKELAQIDFAATSTVEFIQTATLGTGTTARQCVTPYEARIRPETNAAGAVRWHVVITMVDSNTGLALDKAQATFANSGGI